MDERSLIDSTLAPPHPASASRRKRRANGSSNGSAPRRRAPKRFIEETPWPEFVALSQVLQDYLAEVTNRVIGDARKTPCVLA